MFPASKKGDDKKKSSKDKPTTPKKASGKEKSSSKKVSPAGTFKFKFKTLLQSLRADLRRTWTSQVNQTLPTSLLWTNPMVKPLTTLITKVMGSHSHLSVQCSEAQVGSLFIKTSTQRARRNASSISSNSDTSATHVKS
jgi:hypothetical protein